MESKVAFEKERDSPLRSLGRHSKTREDRDFLPRESSGLENTRVLESEGEERKGDDEGCVTLGGGVVPQRAHSLGSLRASGDVTKGGSDFFAGGRRSRNGGEEDRYPTCNAGWRKGGYGNDGPSGPFDPASAGGGGGEEESECYPNCDVDIWMRSCEKEVICPLPGIAKGVIPHWIKGTLLRNGPGRMHFGETSFKHLFDCSALLHRFAINEGKVTYQCRFLRSKTFLKNMAANRIIVTEFGTKAVPDPCQSIFSRVSALFNPGEYQSDNAMISIYPFGDEYYAFTELPVVHRIHPKSLATLERVNLGEKMGIVSHTSHPHVLEDGTVFNIGMTVGLTGPKYTLFRFTPLKSSNENANGEVDCDHLTNPYEHEKFQGNAESTTSIESDKDEDGHNETHSKDPFSRAETIGGVAVRWPFHPGYMHSFGITENFFVIIEQPLSISVAESVKTTIFNEPMAAAFRWYQDYPTLFHLVERSTGRLSRTYSSDAFFYLHVINSYEIEEEEGSPAFVVVDICCYQDPAMLDCMYINALEGARRNPDYADMFHGRPLRFKLPLQKGGQKDSPTKVRPEQICDLGCETPTINYRRNLGKKYRYFYAISSDVNSDNPGTLIKVDCESGSAKTWSQRNVFPSEPIFVPSPDAKDEDDGVVLSALVWGKEDTEKAGLLVLDAKAWTELGRVEFQLPGPSPKCLHGWFVPGLV